MANRRIRRWRALIRPTVPAFTVALLTACASGTVVTRGGGASLDAAQAEPALGGRYRVAVGTVIDKTDPAAEHSVARQLDVLNAGRLEEARLRPDAITRGIQDMLITELFNVDRFIVLERAGLDAVVTEQEFSGSARAGDATRIPPGQLEGAELIVLGAITAFDAGAEGGALPIPVPFIRDGHYHGYGLLRLRAGRGHIAMDLRVIDARTGRVLSSTAVEGRNTRFGFDFDVRLRSGHSRVYLPGALQYFENTPVEKALQEMVTAAVGHISARAPVN